jgi:flagellar motor switch protein FliM
MDRIRTHRGSHRPARQLAAAERTSPGDPRVGSHGDPGGEFESPAIAPLRDLHERLAADFQGSLRRELRSGIGVRLRGLSMVSYGQFLLNRSLPTCFALVTARPIDATLALDLSPSILFPLLDRMLGGELAPPSQRPMTELETRLAARLVGWLLGDYAARWEHILSLQLELNGFLHNPQQVRVMPGSEPTLLARFEIQDGRAFGYGEFCVPAKAIRRMTSRLSADEQPRPGCSADADDETPVELRMTLPDVDVDAAQLANLAAGDLITVSTSRHGSSAVASSAAPSSATPTGPGGGASDSVAGRPESAAGPATELR